MLLLPLLHMLLLFQSSDDEEEMEVEHLLTSDEETPLSNSETPLSYSETEETLETEETQETEETLEQAIPNKKRRRSPDEFDLLCYEEMPERMC